jgi:hypothetical protein
MILHDGGDMLANEIVERYIEALLEVPDIWNKFSIPPVWVPEVIRALTRAGQHAFPMQWQERRHRDAIRRTEHLSLDVCIADPSSWGPPVFIARHVGEPRRAAIQYAAWQLLATRTQRRVLVAYYEVKSDVRDRAAVEAAVRDVCIDNPGQNVPNDIIVISADANARPSSAQELREIFGHIILGKLA